MIAVGVIDVGSPRSGKLGWAVEPPGGPPATGKDLDAFILAMADLAVDHQIAIGFEAPVFIPARAAALDILTGRKGEGSRPWSAGAGATVTTSALAVMAYTLAGLRSRLPDATATMDWTDPGTAGQVLFFEAFVTKTAKGVDHADDALIAAVAAAGLLNGSQVYRSAIDEVEVFNLLGATLLRTGWSTDLGVLSTPCLVVRPDFDHTLMETIQ